ncbi:Uncharacterised protein r2_g3666 [Pycnogonum litorale]
MWCSTPCLLIVESKRGVRSSGKRRRMLQNVFCGGIERPARVGGSEVFATVDGASASTMKIEEFERVESAFNIDDKVVSDEKIRTKDGSRYLGQVKMKMMDLSGDDCQLPLTFPPSLDWGAVGSTKLRRRMLRAPAACSGWVDGNFGSGVHKVRYAGAAIRN